MITTAQTKFKSLCPSHARILDVDGSRFVEQFHKTDRHPEPPASLHLGRFWDVALSNHASRNCNHHNHVPESELIEGQERDKTPPLLKTLSSPGWCGLVDWVLACKPKGLQFDSQSGHMPRLWARCPVGGVWEATTHWCFSFSLLSPL